MPPHDADHLPAVHCGLVDGRRWLGLTSIWWLMAPPGLVFILIGWLREPGRQLQAVIAGVAFLALGYWLFAW
jgi:hypothetical protein